MSTQISLRSLDWTGRAICLAGTYYGLYSSWSEPSMDPYPSSSNADSPYVIKRNGTSAQMWLLAWTLCMHVVLSTEMSKVRVFSSSGIAKGDSSPNWRILAVPCWINMNWTDERPD